MRDVSVRLLDALFEALAAKHLPPEVLAEGTPYSVAHLTNKHERIDWDAFVRIGANAGRIWGDEELEVIGGAIFRSPLVRSVLLPARLLFSARDIYRWVLGDAGGLGQNMVPCARKRYREIDRERSEIELTFPETHAYSREYFIIAKGAMSGMPCALGLPPAQVTMEPVAGGARYRITFRGTDGLLVRVWEALRWPSTARAAARELKDAHDVLRERYLQLEDSRALVQRQARQLRTAVEISNVVHGDLELAQTAAAIARTLVMVADFAAAEVEVTNDLDDRPLRWREQSGSRDGAGAPLELSLAVRGKAVGVLRLWPVPGADTKERLELLESVAPTVCMAVGNALTFKTVLDYKNHLEDRVAERTNELASARDHLAATVTELEQAQAARDRIFANINHEIRTPLALILLTSGDLQHRLGPALDEETRARFGSIEANVQQLLSLVDGMLLLAAGRESKLRLRPAPHDLGTMLARVVRAWVPAAELAGVALRYEGARPQIAVFDEVAIDRAVANLLSNAIKFTPAGGTITVGLLASERHTEISVRDTGIGIDDEFKARMFGRFEQGRPAVRPAQRGSGIGLSIAKELVEAHGGAITVDGNAGGGSVFRLSWPRADDSAGPATPATEVRAVLSQPLRPLVPATASAKTPQVTLRRQATGPLVLVAEDDPELRAALESLLSPEYRVLVAADGLGALSLARQHLPDLLVTDIGMPGMDGIELTRRFRELVSNRLAPVVVLTAHAGVQDRIAGLTAGAVDYVTKPFHPPELLARIRAQLAIRELALRLHDSEKLAALGTLAAGLTHEIRNPANGVVNAIGPLRQLLPPEVLAPGSATAELLDVISTCAEQIASLSRQLLGFARQDTLVMGEVPLPEVIDRAAALTRPLFAHITLECDLEYRGALVCSGSLLAQVVMNLLENAAHAAGRGGTVRLRSHAQNGRVLVDVSDSGAGIPADVRARIFEPFFTTKPPGAGTGLGLSTSRLVVERHRGSLTLVDGSVSGATFRIDLPLPDGAATV